MWESFKPREYLNTEIPELAELAFLPFLLCFSKRVLSCIEKSYSYSSLKKWLINERKEGNRRSDIIFKIVDRIELVIIHVTNCSVLFFLEWIRFSETSRTPCGSSSSDVS